MSKANFKQPWFAHDYNSRHDPKLLDLVTELKYEGLGIYWCLIEILYEQGGHLPVNKIKSTAYSLHVKQNLLIKILENFELFEKNDDSYFSNACLERLKIKEETSAIRSENGAKGGIAKANKNVATAKNLQEQNLAIREENKTGNESTGQNSTLEKRKEDNIVPSEENESPSSPSPSVGFPLSLSSPTGNDPADSSSSIDPVKKHYGDYNNVILSDKDIIDLNDLINNEPFKNKLINDLSEKRNKGQNDYYSYKKNDIKLLERLYEDSISNLIKKKFKKRKLITEENELFTLHYTIAPNSFKDKKFNFKELMDYISADQEYLITSLLKNEGLYSEENDSSILNDKLLPDHMKGKKFNSNDYTLFMKTNKISILENIS